jgi:hypothetical protein
MLTVCKISFTYLTNRRIYVIVDLQNLCGGMGNDRKKRIS